MGTALREGGVMRSFLEDLVPALSLATAAQIASLSIFSIAAIIVFGG